MFILYFFLWVNLKSCCFGIPACTEIIQYKTSQFQHCYTNLHAKKPPWSHAEKLQKYDDDETTSASPTKGLWRMWVIARAHNNYVF